MTCDRVTDLGSPDCGGPNHPAYDRAALERKIAGALRNTIHAHGPITPEHIGSAAKRVYKAVVGHLKGAS